MISLNNLFGYSLKANLESHPTIKIDANLCISASELSKFSTMPQCKVAPILAHAVELMLDDQIAIGEIDNGIVVELYSPADEKTYMVLFNTITGTVSGLVIPNDSSAEEMVVTAPSAKSSTETITVATAIFASVCGVMMNTSVSSEFKDEYDRIAAEFRSAAPSSEVVTRSLIMMTSHIFGRTYNTTLSAPEFVSVEISSPLPKIKPASIKSGALNPKKVICGNFEILEPASASTASGTTTKKSNKSSSIEELKGKYAYGAPVHPDFTDLIPDLPSSIIVNPVVDEICKAIQASPYIRNIGLTGPAGTGKTVTAQQIAYGTGRPYFVKTCSTNDEITDFTVIVMPDTESIDGTISSEDKKAISNFVDMGGLSTKNFAEIMDLPTASDMLYATEASYEALTGKPMDGITKEEAVAEYDRLMNLRIHEFIQRVNASGASNKQKFKCVYTPFMQAMKYGGVVELQEPNVILQPGVLVGLNSMMEKSGTIQLPTGEKIVRHPDAVVVVTTNGNYEGCRDMNQSVKSRLNLLYRMENPAVETMAARVQAKTGFEDITKLTEMAQIICDIASSMTELGIADGVCGPRELENWAIMSQITGDIYNSAITTVISKISDEEESRETCLKRLAESSFAPKRRKSKI